MEPDHKVPIHVEIYFVRLSCDKINQIEYCIQIYNRLSQDSQIGNYIDLLEQKKTSSRNYIGKCTSLN